MESKIKKILTQYLFILFIGLGILLFVKEGLLTGVWSLGGPSSVHPIFKGNILVWIFLLTSLVVYFIFALVKKNTHLSISAGHVFLTLSYLILPIWWEYKILYAFVNCLFLGANLSYWIYFYLKEKEILNEDVLDA